MCVPVCVCACMFVCVCDPSIRLFMLIQSLDISPWGYIYVCIYVCEYMHIYI